MYKVVKAFTDLQDHNHAYNVGDVFPHKGADVSDKRIAELASAGNKRGVVLIEKVKEETPTIKQESPIVEDSPAIEDKPKKGGKKRSDVK